MCTNYKSPDVAEVERMIADLKMGEFWRDLHEREVYPSREGMIIRRGRDGQGHVADAATFGLIPPWSKDTRIVRATNNARTETVHEKPSYRAAWANARFCLVPMVRYYEPCYETGRAVRWAISRSDAPVLMVAAIWSYWPGAGEQGARLSFSLLTMNCDGHPVLRRFHSPEDEKRSLIHVTPDHWDAWLDAKPTEAPAFFQLPPADVLQTDAAPAPTRKRKAELPLGFVEED